jgi:hypothetical protein
VANEELKESQWCFLFCQNRKNCELDKKLRREFKTGQKAEGRKGYKQALVEQIGLFWLRNPDGFPFAMQSKLALKGQFTLVNHIRNQQHLTHKGKLVREL